jgi:hypothetical protein
MASSARGRLEAMAADRGPTTILRPVRRRKFAPASARGRGTVARWRRRRTQWISQAGNAASRPTTGVPQTPTSTATLTSIPRTPNGFVLEHHDAMTLAVIPVGDGAHAPARIHGRRWPCGTRPTRMAARGDPQGDRIGPALVPPAMDRWAPNSGLSAIPFQSVDVIRQSAYRACIPESTEPRGTHGSDAS